MQKNYTFITKFWKTFYDDLLYVGDNIGKDAFSTIGLNLESSVDPLYMDNDRVFASTGWNWVVFVFIDWKNTCHQMLHLLKIGMYVPMGFDNNFLLLWENLQQFLSLWSSIWYDVLEQLVYDFDWTCSMIEKWLNNQDPSTKSILVQISQELWLAPWNNCKSRLSNLQSLYFL
jgi:hypothetical protein